MLRLGSPSSFGTRFPARFFFGEEREAAEAGRLLFPACFGRFFAETGTSAAGFAGRFFPAGYLRANFSLETTVFRLGMISWRISEKKKDWVGEEFRSIACTLA